jgi:hypothetical protein
MSIAGAATLVSCSVEAKSLAIASILAVLAPSIFTKSLP